MNPEGLKPGDRINPIADDEVGKKLKEDALKESEESLERLHLMLKYHQHRLDTNPQNSSLQHQVEITQRQINNYDSNFLSKHRYFDARSKELLEANAQTPKDSLEKTQTAIEYWKYILERFPENNEARNALERLSKEAE